MELSKKQIGILGTVMPLGFVLGMALRILLTTDGEKFEKYNIKNFSIIDTLKIDTAVTKKGELYIDTLIDYSRVSKKYIEFKNKTTDYALRPKGLLIVKSEESSRYNRLEKGILSEKIGKKRFEERRYYLIGDLIGEGFELDKAKLFVNELKSVPGFPAEPTLNLPRASMYSRNQDNYLDTTYTSETEEGKKALDYEKANVINYLNKIKKQKEVNGTWKD